MNKEEILEKSRKENRGKRDEREQAAFGASARVGMLVGALVCAAMVLAGEFVFNVPEIGFVAWTVYFVMQGSSNIVLSKKLGARKKLIWGIVEIILASAFIAAMFIRKFA